MLDPKNIISSKEYYVPLYAFETLFKRRVMEFFVQQFGADWLAKIDQPYLNEKILKIISAGSHDTVQNELVFNSLSLGDIVQLFTPSHIVKTKSHGLLCYVFGYKSKEAGSQTAQTVLYNRLVTIRQLRTDIFHFKEIIFNHNYSHITSTIGDFIYRMDKDKQVTEVLKTQFGIVVNQPTKR